MVWSMTAFASKTYLEGEHPFTIELKTLNSKGVDLIIKMPSFLREKEMEIRKKLTNSLLRGKIEFSFRTEILPHQPNLPSLNEALVKDYFKAFRNISPNLSHAQMWPMVIKMPEILQVCERNLTDDLDQFLDEAISKLIDQLIVQRNREGLEIKKVLSIELEKIQENLNLIETTVAHRGEEIRDKLLEKCKALAVDFDKKRIEQELIFYIEKFDINEETTRLQAHIDYFKVVLETKEPQKGKKLGFIAQEINREINTIGSKANHLEVQKKVVLMKEALERIKEQILNIV